MINCTWAALTSHINIPVAFPKNRYPWLRVATLYSAKSLYNIF